MKLYLVGGAVRDYLLKRPIKDKDYVAVGATEAEFEAMGFVKLSKKDISVFLDPDSKNEYAMARKEDKYDLRNKIVNFSYKDVSLIEDLYRRDFTINAMAINEEDGSLIDPFDGQKDLKEKTLRHVSERFEEDPLRIIRGYRFAAVYGFDIAKETMQLFLKMVARGDLKYIANGRIYLEMKKAEENLTLFLQKIDESRLLSNLFPKSIMYTNTVATPEEALMSLYVNSYIDKEVRDTLIHYGFDKKIVDRLIQMNHSSDLFTLLTKHLRIDQSKSNFEEVMFYYKIKTPEISLKISQYRDSLIKENFQFEIETFSGKELGQKILEKKKAIFNKIFQ